MRGILAFLCLWFLTGCGTITGAAVWLLSQREEGKRVVLPPGAPAVVLYSFDKTYSATVEVRFNLSDPDEDTAQIEVRWWNGSEWETCSSAGGADNPFSASLTAAGTEFTFMWDARYDLSGSASGTYTVAVFVTDDDATVYDEESVDIAIAPPSVTITGVEGQSGDIVLFYTLADAASDPASISVQFTTDGTNWHDATLSPDAPEGTENLETSPSGVAHTFLWASGTDLAGYSGDVTLRITARDEWDFSTPVETAITLDNNTPPTVQILEPSSGETVAGKVTLRISITDAESDSCSVAAWYLDGTTWKTAVLEGQTAGLASSPSGVEHTFQWDALAAFGESTSGVSTTLLVRVFDTKLGSEDSVDLTINNASLPSITIDEISPDDPATQDVTIRYTVYDGDTPSVDITFEYSVDGGDTWVGGTIKSADEGTISGNQISGVGASGTGERHEFVWGSYIDEPDKYYDAVLIRLTVSDGANSSYAISYEFPLNNMVTNDPPTVTIDSPSDGDTVSDLVEVAFTLNDTEGDTMWVEVLYSTDGGSTWETATLLEGDTTGLFNGAHTVFWDTRAEGLGRDDTEDVILKIIPHDPYQVGASDSVEVTVDNTGWSEPASITASEDVISVAVAADTKGFAHIVWCDKGGPLYYSRGRYDRLTSPQRIGEGYRVSATSYQDIIYISYIYAGGVFVKKRDPSSGWETVNGGAPILSATGNTLYLASDIAVDADGRISVVAIKRRDLGPSSFYSIVETHSADGGANWSGAVQLAGLGTSTSGKVAACFDADSNLHTTYDVDGQKVFYVCVTSSGLSGSPQDISASGYGEQRAPDIAFSGSRKIITVVWRGEFGYTPVLLCRVGAVNGGGITWESAREVPDTAQSPHVDNPSCLFSDSRFCIVWEGTGSGGYSDIFAKEWQEGSWEPKQNISNTTYRQSLFPDVAVGGKGNFHAAWVDSDSSGNPIVCYALR